MLRSSLSPIFIAGKLRSFICQSQGHAKSNASRLETQAEDLLTNSEDTDNYGDHTKEPFRRRLLLFRSSPDFSIAWNVIVADSKLLLLITLTYSCD